MLIDRARIAELIPHAGSMCLLDAVLDYDDERMVCSASSHRQAAHPLAHAGRLGAACAIEYAAQAMALHGALTRLQGQRPRAGLLIGLRDTVIGAQALDSLAEDLRIEVEQVAGGAGGVIYRFAVSAGDVSVASGRATVVLDEKELSDKELSA